MHSPARLMFVSTHGLFFAEPEVIAALEAGDQTLIQSICEELEQLTDSVSDIPEGTVQVPLYTVIGQLLPYAAAAGLVQACQQVIRPDVDHSHTQTQRVPARIAVNSAAGAYALAACKHTIAFEGADFGISADELMGLGNRVVSSLCINYGGDFRMKLRELSHEARYQALMDDTPWAIGARTLVSRAAISDARLEEFCGYVRQRHPDGIPICADRANLFEQALNNPKVFALYRLSPEAPTLPAPPVEIFDRNVVNKSFRQLATHSISNGAIVYQHLGSNETIVVSQGEPKEHVLGQIALLSVALENYYLQLEELERSSNKGEQRWKNRS